MDDCIQAKSLFAETFEPRSGSRDQPDRVIDYSDQRETEQNHREDLLEGELPARNWNPALIPERHNEGRGREAGYGVSQPRRIRLTAIAASNNEINFDTPFIPCLPIQRVKWLA
jgi:hypothetical protein